MDSELKVESLNKQTHPLGYCIGMVGRVAFSDHLESCATYTTWQSVDGFTKNQIEHSLIDERHALNIMDVRSCRACKL
jgi:hypothetical protein